MGLCRHPRTQQERRENWEYARPRRRLLPTAWDDFFKYGVTCWKKYRKTQYRVKTGHHKDSRQYGLSMAKRDHFHYEHRRCSWDRNRCKYCVKYGLWDEYDKERDRKHKRIMEQR